MSATTLAPEPVTVEEITVFAGEAVNPKTIVFNLYDGGYHCNQLAYNKALENDKNPGPADTYPNSYLPGYAYENLVDDGVSHPTKPIENTVGYAYMWCAGATPGHPQPTHVCYYEYSGGDTATIYWGEGKKPVNPISYDINGDPSRLPVTWVYKIEFIPTDVLNEE